jgi:anaerobic magnesium-protoporphyrin IX monomethyl ester cyclase
MQWYTRMGRRVWPHEVLGFLFRDRRTGHGPTVGAFWGPAQDAEEESMVPHRKSARPPEAVAS